MRAPAIFKALENLFRYFHDNTTAGNIKRQLLSCLGDAANPEAINEHRDALRAIYETALRLLEKEAADHCFETGLLSLQRGLYRELEYILASGCNDARHDFLVVIPVADRPIMLKNCLESLVEQCRIFQYGGATIDMQGRPVYNKISALIIDDSKEEDNMRKIRSLCAENATEGIRTFYFGLEEQAELLRQVPARYQEQLRGLLGEAGGLVQSHKGASASRNIAYLYLHSFLGEADEKTLIFFLDSDEEFKIKIRSKSGITDIPFINYFYWLDKIFDTGKVDIVTGKVVGDPPVSPAVMINTFLEDITLFLETIENAAAEGRCFFHDDQSDGNSSADYHDMVKLFGYRSPTSPRKYHCGLSGDHSTADCLDDFSKRTLGFFYGLHPTRTQLYIHGGDFTKTEGARTVYTGNYVFNKAGLRHFIPFADLKLRMAGPVLGRILRKRLHQGFVSANLPLLHKRTFQADYGNEFRSGISTGKDSIDLSQEFNRQFWGDVMLFSIEKLAELGYPDKRLGVTRISQVAHAVEKQLRDLYIDRQTEIEDKTRRIESFLASGQILRDGGPNAKRAVENIRSFCSLVKSNFGLHSSGMDKISEQVDEGSYINMIINSIHCFYETDIAWAQLLQSDLAVTSHFDDICITIPD